MSARAATTSPASGSNNSQPTLTSQARTSDDEDEFMRTKILLLGLRRSGKTSIQQFLFDDLNLKQAFFVEPTMKLTKHKVDSFLPLEIWDCPGNVTIESLGVPLSMFTTIVFVIDIQDSYHNAIARLIDFSITAFQENPHVNLEIFVHKAEALAEEYRTESFRHIQTRLLEELADLPSLTINFDPPNSPSKSSLSEASFDPMHIPYNFHLTSVYDHSLQEAFARVFTRILAPGSLPYLEELLNAFISTSSSSKAFLFDTKAKFFVATDSSPVDSVTLGLCCDYVHMLNQFGNLYKSAIASPTTHPRRREMPAQSSLYSTPSNGSLPASPKSGTARSDQSPQSFSGVTSRAPTPTHTSAVSNAEAKSPVSRPSTSRSRSETGGMPVNPDDTAAKEGIGALNTNKKKPLFQPSAAASLTPYTTIVFNAVTPRLALVALLPTSVWESKRGLVEYNIVFFREGVQEIYDLEQDTRRKRKRKTAESTQTAPSKAAPRR